MELDQPVYKGFLLLPPIGKILKKSWQKKYCLLFKSSKFGIGRLEIYETETKTGQPKIVTFESVIKITPKSSNTFSILTKTAEHDFGTITDESLKDWVRAIQLVTFPDEVSQITSIEEDNDLYCSTDEGVFYVKLHSSPVTEKCNLESKNYTLVLTSTALQLRSEVENQLLYTWPYCYIRRYGYKHGKFTFEAGRKCESGEGTFSLEHPHQQEIFRCLSTKMKSMKKLLSGESTTSLLDCGDVQLHAALSMEARSRSPLPPSPTAPPSFQESKLSSRSHITLSSIESKSSVKPMPKKPPRKAIPPKTLPVLPISVSFDSQHDYQHVGKYDMIESRSDAWRTMGVDDVSHTEQTVDDEQEEYLSWGQMDTIKKALNEAKPKEKTLAPAVITEHTTSTDGQYYDHLNFFGSSSRLNISSGYNQVLPPPLPPVTTPPSFNDYDEVLCIEPARSADDSHLGYALVRKDPANSGLKEIKIKDKVSHQLYNEEPYAVVSKPKRV